MHTIMKPARVCAVALAGSMIFLMILVLAAGCTGQATAVRLNGTEWTLVQYTHNAQTIPALAGNPVTLTFGNDGNLAGSAGCNRYFASWQASGSSLTVGQAASTMMYCGEPGVMDQESAYLGLLPEAGSFTLNGDNLVISDKSGNAILTFTKSAAPAVIPLVGTNWTLSTVHSGNAVSSVITGSTVTAVFDSSGKMAGSAGCNRYFAGYTANGTSMTISGIGSTRMMCPEQDVMNQESAYLAALESVQGYQINGNTLVLTDNNNSTVITFSGQP